jgi:hypothetical protein
MFRNLTTVVLPFVLVAGSRASSDLAVVPFFDCDRASLLDNWGGPLEPGNLRGIQLQTEHVHTGQRALALDLGQLNPGDFRYFQFLASGFGPVPAYCQTRDLTGYERIEFWAQNVTGVELHCRLQLKDFRDSLQHRATYAFALPARPEWVHVVVPLQLTASDWTQQGNPDLSRIASIDFLFGTAVARTSGQVYLDDVVFVDRGGSLDIETASLRALVERLARRQWRAMWAARSRTLGLIPNNSYQSTDAGTNTTAAMLWTLPAALRHQWLSQAEADEYVALLTNTAGRLLDRAKYLPPRNVDWLSLKPSLLPEESSVDAAFLALAMHQYKALRTTPTQLRQAIDATENRFDFAAFGCPTGWRMAYRYPTACNGEGFTACTYDGYTNEGNLVSLAAHLADRRHVPIETYWNASSHRVRARTESNKPAPVVHSLPEFRAPFTQALLNLFVDVRQRGPDKFPDDRLAVNPWENFVCYEQNVMCLLSARGRAGLVQPDAGDDGSLTCYRQFSAYEDFGQSDLFMPWSVSFALLAGVDGSEGAFRNLLRHQLYGPFGLADSARWTTGTAKPSAITPRHDFWNTALSTMAFLEFLDNDTRQSKSFSLLPEVRRALDQVFHSVPESGAGLSRSVTAGP